MSTEKLKRSRQRLLDLTLRNRLLNFRPGNPGYADDLRTHKHIVLNGQVDAVWNELVEGQRPIEVVVLTREEQALVTRELRYKKERETGRPATDLVLSKTGAAEWDDIKAKLRRVEQHYRKGDLISLLPEELFYKRLTKIRNEQNTLANSTGDSAMFLAIGFLQWSEKEPHPKAGEKMFAPLLLVHVNLEQRKRQDGGHRDFLLRMDADQPQGNPCLAEKLRQDFGFDFPDLEEDETATDYLARITKLLRLKREWTVSSNIALGFFNFSRYRLWLDLDPNQWPADSSPAEHPIVSAILSGNPLPQPAGIPNENEVAAHQEEKDLPIVLDADSTQYAALLACERGISTVIEGPPGSGKSQTIANLIAVAMNAGKKVLFVAQKLPALQVVQRRLDKVGLDAFCLPLFSDKARVAEMHAHLARTQTVRESARRPRPYSNGVTRAALKLNAFATQLREPPEGFEEGAGTIIQRGTALHLQLRDLWGTRWTDELLEVSLKQRNVTPEWLDEREQTLHQWHSLYVQAGVIWSDWSPLRLGPMDISGVEGAIAGVVAQAEALKSHLVPMPSQFHESTSDYIEDLCRDIRKSKFERLSDVLPSLLDFIWASQNNANSVARLEHEVTEFNRQLSVASKRLRITNENRTAAAAAIAESIGTVTRIFNLRQSIPQAKASLAALNEAIRAGEALIALAAALPDGISALHGSAEPEAKSVVKWHHVDLLSRHNGSPDLDIPADCLPLLARHVNDDEAKEREAQTFAESLGRCESCVSRLTSRSMLDLLSWKGSDFDAIENSVRTLLKYSLADLNQTDFNKTGELLNDVLSSGGNCRSPEFLALFSRMLPETTVTLSEVNRLKAFAALSPELLSPPSKQTSRELLLRVVRRPDSEEILDRLIASVTRYRECFYNLKPHFKVSLETVSQTFLARQAESLVSIQQLGLQDLTLASVIEFKQTAARIREATATALETCETFRSWPYLVPETLKDVGDLKSLLLHLSYRPPASPDLSWEQLCQDGLAGTVSTAKTKARDLNQFRQHRSKQVAFNDLPGIEQLAKHRRDLRRFSLSWTRWFSTAYYSLRRDIRSFLKPPFPSDQDTLLLLDELDAFESRRVAFERSPVGAVLGQMFCGMETEWASVDLITGWVEKLKALTQAGDVMPFVLSSSNTAEKVRDAIGSLELFLRTFPQQCSKLPNIPVLQNSLADLENLSLREFSETLKDIERRVGIFIDRVQSDLTCSLDQRCSSVSETLDLLKAAYDAEQDLNKYAELSEPLLPRELETSTVERCRDWLTQIKSGRDEARFVVGSDAQCRDWLTQIRSGRPEINIIVRILEEDFTLADHSMAKAAIPFERDLSLLSERLPSFCRHIERDAPVAAALEQIAQVAQALEAIASESRFQSATSALTIGDIAQALSDLHEITALKSTFESWKTVLGPDPSSLRSSQVRSTLDWLQELRRRGAKGNLLYWLLNDATVERVKWWQQTAMAAGALKGMVTGIQNAYVLGTSGPPNEEVAAWCAEWRNVSAQTLAALETVEAFANSSDDQLRDLSGAASALVRAVEIHSELIPWKARINIDPVTLEASQLTLHRSWTATVRSLPVEIGNWLVSADTTSRCEVILALEARIKSLKTAAKKCKEIFESFGPIQRDGPFKVFLITGKPEEIIQRCRICIGQLPSLPTHAALLREELKAQKLGIRTIIKHARKHDSSSELLVETLRGAAAYQAAKQAWSASDELQFFQSDSHQRLRQKFQRDDETQLKTNQEFIHARLAQVTPAEGIRGRTAGEHTQNSLLQHEIQKQKRHLPIRKLVQRAGQAMQALCPCWMMTPLSVAQFLTPGAIEFDVVVMDEASQINPEDAWGAIARGKQTIIVGDQKQMPPSDFFMSALDDSELPPEEEEDIDGGKAESILDASFASLLSSSLRWHYRSRHECLIAPANSFSYDNRLILFPHPYREHSELGIRYQFVPDAITTTGKVVNAIEAEVIARRVRELVIHEYEKPEGKRMSIGVVTMNLPHQDCLMDLLESMQRNDRRFDKAMTALSADDVAEPFFVRNLENIQGDERDIMIISCTYGPNTRGGTPTQRFGPLTREGGERRFNVLITRAKWRMEVFASIRSNQILADGKRQGIQDFHSFLKYAETGALDTAGVAGNRPSDSPFEIQVEAILKREGFNVDRQVGVAGYFIDLAVRHPVHTGLFAIGIECDGATYHSSRAARDRDRLREQVLIERGWKLHRIWSTDWFVNPQQEKARLIDAVGKACREDARSIFG